MPKAKSVRTVSTSSGDKLSIPGVNITELLEFEDLFPQIRYYLATLMLPIVTIAQIRIALITEKPAIIQNLQSTNLLNRLILAKSVPLVYVTAAVAIRRTAVAYANSEDPGDIVRDHADLWENTSGPIITRGGITSALNEPERMRAYRRGIMSQTTGSMQATPIHYPRKIARDLEKVSPEDFLSRLPFKTSDFTIDEIYTEVNSLISPNGNNITCVEQPTIPSGQILLENGLRLTRSMPAFPDISQVPADISKLPAWRRAAITQAKNLGGGR